MFLNFLLGVFLMWQIILFINSTATSVGRSTTASFPCLFSPAVTHSVAVVNRCHTFDLHTPPINIPFPKCPTPCYHSCKLPHDPSSYVCPPFSCRKIWVSTAADVITEVCADHWHTFLLSRDNSMWRGSGESRSGGETDTQVDLVTMEKKKKANDWRDGNKEK